MTLIRSISGIRGTVGGTAGKGLSPVDILRFTAAYAWWIKQNSITKHPKVVIGRDARISGNMVSKLVTGTLMGSGIDVIDTGLAATPTVEMAVMNENADGGIIVTASHNPGEWNALKLLNNKGEFISDNDGHIILEMVDNENIFSKISYPDSHHLGSYADTNGYHKFHIQKILSLPCVDVPAIRQAGFTVVVDAVNSVGGIVIPELLEALGVKTIHRLFCEPDGRFPHNPEPLPEHLTDISEMVIRYKADLGFVVDPDVDRLAIVCEDGSMFGEEYTLVSVADYVLRQTPGNTVSNLSSTRALRDITLANGNEYFASAVGEVNVVEQMKKCNAVIGGEGNGGVIFPALHYGRDALVGIALFLSNLAKSNLSCSQLKSTYPEYHIIKKKLPLTNEDSPDEMLDKLKNKFKNTPGVIINDTDGVKLDFSEGWVHMRKSNTEPILRIYAESRSIGQAEKLVEMALDGI
ncbi:MAG: phosphoglucosamine mutase [Bacteroidia bacterium]|nr:phosphoglucosamine mutase [Bacteroidia bacterium]